MNTEDSRTHVFFQHDPDVELFSYGGGMYTKEEVDILQKFLPSTIVIRFVRAEYPLWHPGHPANREKLN